MSKNKRISTVLALLLIFIFSTVFLLTQKGVTNFLSKASEEIKPDKVKITNVTDRSFVVSWVTSKKTNGFVSLFKNGEELLMADVRGVGEYFTHYIEVENLQAETVYEFQLVSGGKRFLNEEGKKYQVKTALLVAGDLPSANLASGTVFTENQEFASGAIVYLQIRGISFLSSLVTNQGNWAVSLAKAFSEDLTGIANYVEGEEEENIFVEGGNLGFAEVIVYTKDDDPVPPIILGEKKDLRGKNLVEEKNQEKISSSRLENFATEQKPAQKPFSVSNPEEGETLSFPRPEIFGSGAAGGIVEIVLESPVKFQSKVTVGSDGVWRWTPPQDLSSGAHTLTVRYLDPETGKEETVVRTFVLAANSNEFQPSFVSSSSGEIVVPTPTITPLPTLLPTMTIAPTLTPILTMTPTPTVIERTTMPSTDSAVPKTGFDFFTFFLPMLGSVFFVLAVFFARF